MSLRTVFISLLLLVFSEVLVAQVDSMAVSQDTIPVRTSMRGRTLTPESVILSPADTTNIPTITDEPQKMHSPSTAILLSIVPGVGQIYNKKWWKVPIIYAGLGVSAYFIYTNASQMVIYQNEYFFRLHGAEEYYDPDLSEYVDPANILALKRNYQRNMEIAIGVCAIFYMLNLIDALVDAHLYYFDISDDLSLHLAPTILMPEPRFHTFAPGISLKLKF